MDTCIVAVQLFASVTVKEYTPAMRLNVPVPAYGGVPPVAVTVTEDESPLQRIGGAIAAMDRIGGCVIVTDVVALQLFASVTVKV